MKMVPNLATKVTREDGKLKGEWSDRSLDDDERYTAEDSVFLYAEVDEGSDDEKRLNLALINKFDQWIKATRT